jgi:hypothetical protein
MPVGILDVPDDQEIADLGFAICTEMTMLGIVINNKGTGLEDNFERIIAKVRTQIAKWSRFTLSLPGKIAISKTMLVSQIGYLACIVTPTAAQTTVLQDMIDNYVTHGIVIAKDRLYTKPKYGGLGLINVANYCTALQCSWIKRCYIKINDIWRWNIAVSCNFNLDMIRIENVNARTNPIVYNIVKSFTELQKCFWQKNENFLTAPLVDNMFFLRAEPGRRAPVRGCVDKNLLGENFYSRHKETLLSLRMNCLVVGNRIVSLERLRLVTGLPFTDNMYMYLTTAGRFAIKKYCGKPDSNGTSLTIAAYLERIKKGSGKYRRLIEGVKMTVPKVEDLRVVKTFFGLGNCEISTGPEIGLLLSLWCITHLTVRVRTFAFQFFNNSVSVAARTAARYRNAGIDQRCALCIKGGVADPAREEFAHLFIDCAAIKPTITRYFRKAFDLQYNTLDANCRRFKLTGLMGAGPYLKKFFNVVNMLFLNYVTWQYRLKKIVPSLASLENDIDSLFEGLVTSSKLFEEASDTDVYICRRWRENHNRRG